MRRAEARWRAGDEAEKMLMKMAARSAACARQHKEVCVRGERVVAARRSAQDEKRREKARGATL